MALTVKRFTADWCSPCKAVAPIINKLAGKYTDVKFETYDIEEDERMAEQYNVRSIPLVIFEQDGKKVESIMGYQPEDRYESAIKQYK